MSKLREYFHLKKRKNIDQKHFYWIYELLNELFAINEENYVKISLDSPVIYCQFLSFLFFY
jgi:hypothetical protein